LGGVLSRRSPPEALGSPLRASQLREDHLRGFPFSLDATGAWALHLSARVNNVTRIVHAMLAAGISRRDVLRILAAGAAAGVGAAALPQRLVRASSPASNVTLPTYGFLTSAEMVTLDAATAHIVPTDSEPGAHECGVIDYIQNMLSFMPGSDANCDRHVNAADITATILATHAANAACPGGGDVDGSRVVDAADVVQAEAAVFNAKPVYGGGPFSGRNPQSHFPTGNTGCLVCHGAPLPTGTPLLVLAQSGTVDNYPPDFFTEHLPLPRLRALSWKVRILGAAAVPEVSNNPLAADPTMEVDLRNRYRDGLASLDTISQQKYGKPFGQLTASQQTAIFSSADPAFIRLLAAHTVEGMLCAPEYGGNRDRLGWQLVGFDGDSQPEGYAVYDPTVPGHYRERADKPNSGPNPDEDCHGFSAAMNSFLTLIAQSGPVQPGQQFSDPYCLDLSST
jgi:gluconate 2-dehydrogenase subunit 3-like protein